MFKYLVLIHLIITVVPETSGYKQRIIGGSDAPQGLYPYQISLRYFGNGDHICGGSIINHEWVITAAHCVSGISPINLTVVAGSNNLSSGGSNYAVTEVHVHENYDSVYIKNDVAIVKVERIAFANDVFSIVLETEHVGGAQPCTVSGWGLTSYPSEIISNMLQHINLTTITVEECKRVLSVDENQICTLTKRGEGTCTYDSGSPLVRKVNGITKQIGIVSWMIQCARGYPDAYARISKYVNWFNQKCGNCSV